MEYQQQSYGHAGAAAAAGGGGGALPHPYSATVVAPPYNAASSSPGGAREPADLLVEHFPQAAKLTREDLEEMLRTPDYFDAFFGTLPQTIALYKEHEAALKANQEVAAKNMALRERHEALKEDTLNAFNDARRLQERWQAHTNPQMMDAYKPFDQKVLLSRLRHALGDQDRLSEALIASLVEGSISEDDFIKQFKEIRTLFYRRTIQTEKWLAGQVHWRDQLS